MSNSAFSRASIFGGGERFLLPLLGLGLALRIVLGGLLGPLGGDPVFSYSYRALLLSHGEWSGLFKMWHPPGFPVILAFLHTLSGYSIEPYKAGLLLNLACYVALTLIVDGLIRSKVDQTTRLITATCLAFWETLFYWESVPVTEPLYAVLLYGTIALLARWDGEKLKTIFLCAVLMGIAGTIRREAIAPWAGMSLWLACQRPLTEKRKTVAVLGVFALGYLLMAGWTFLDPLYRVHMKAQEFSFTVAPVQGLGANITRAVECVYRALVDWLPQVLLLPFWMLAAAGLVSKLGDKTWDRIHSLIFLSLLPALAAVTLTIQHKRTGIFLIPAVAIYFGVGCEWLLRQVSQRRAKCVLPLTVLILTLVVGQSFRILWRLKKFPTVVSDQITYQQGQLAKQHANPSGKIWAFGNEPEVYVHWGKAYDYPFDEREAYARLYSDNAGEPEKFREALRANGIRYVTFSLPAEPRADGTTPQQPYGIVVPKRQDLMSLALFGLKGSTFIAKEDTTVFFVDLFYK